jgi:flagellar basal-body rod modification protein FlgD
VTISIRDAEGNTVATLTDEKLEAGVHTLNWDGLDNQGNRAAEGYYTIDITARLSSGETFTPSLDLIGRVESVIYRDGYAYLSVNGVEVPLGDITAIGEPGTFVERGDGNGDDSPPPPPPGDDDNDGSDLTAWRYESDDVGNGRQ